MGIWLELKASPKRTAVLFVNTDNVNYFVAVDSDTTRIYFNGGDSIKVYEGYNTVHHKLMHGEIQ